MKLNNREFANLTILLNTLKTNAEKFKLEAPLGTIVLILSKIVPGGKYHQVLFSPDSYEILSDVESKFLEFKVGLIEEPKNVGTTDGFVYLYGDKLFYEFLKSKCKMSLFYQ
jgi:hypothetical protein